MKKLLATLCTGFLLLGLLAGCGSKSDSVTIAVPNDTTNEARALLLLQDNGYITLKDGAGITATINDIAENPKNITFNEVEAAQVPNVLKDVDYAIINSNYAIPAGLNPTTARSAACRRLFPTSQASSARSRIPSSKRRPRSSAASSRTASCASRPSFRAAAAALRSWRPSSLCSNYVNSNPYRSTTRTTRPSPTSRTRTSRSAPDKEPLWNKMISSAR